MTQPIQTAILCIPADDEKAMYAVRRMLVDSIPGVVVVNNHSVAMQRYLVEDVLRRWCDEEELDLVLTIGGTLPAPGPSSRELVPDATLTVAERLLPGLPEAMRAYAQEQMPLALIDRSVAAIRGRTLLLNLPAGAATATLFLEAIVDIIAPLLAHLRGEPDSPHMEDDLNPPARNPPAAEDAQTKMESSESPAPPRKALDAGEFAAFLQRKKPPQS